MIRRRLSDSFLLISQHDHGLLAGEMARHLSPAASTSLVIAARDHDIGWQDFDANPIVNSDGEPMDVFDPGNPQNLQTWTLSVNHLQSLDTYAALIVSIHTLQLSTLVMPKADMIDRDSLAAKFSVNQFQHREIERQEQLRKGLKMRTDRPLNFGLAAPGTDSTEDQLREDLAAFRYLDVLSLHLCCGCAPPLPPESKLDVTQVGSETYRVLPYRFGAAEVKLNLRAKRIPRCRYASDSALRDAYRVTPDSQISIRVCRID